MTVQGMKKLVRNEIWKQELSYRELGKRTGLCGQTISYWMRGRNGPSLENTIKVLNALGLDIKVVRKNG